MTPCENCDGRGGHRHSRPAGTIALRRRASAPLENPGDKPGAASILTPVPETLTLLPVYGERGKKTQTPAPGS